MLLPGERSSDSSTLPRPPPPRSASSPIRNSTSHNRRQREERGDHGRERTRHDRGERGRISPAQRRRLEQRRGRSQGPGDRHDPGIENALQRAPSPEQDSRIKVPAVRSSWGGGGGGGGGGTDGGSKQEQVAKRLSAEALPLRGLSAVDRGLVGVADSLRSSWSMSVLPAMPNGQAVPVLLSHLAELRSVCTQQRDFGRSIRKALVRKQGELDEASAEAAWLRAELGFIVGDMLGALQDNPTAATIFRSLSERIRSDLGAEEAAVYIDIGDGTLWLLPGGVNGEDGADCEDGAEVFIQKGIGVVGLVAMGALPGSVAAATDGGRGWVERGDEVDVLLLNDGLEAFDNGTTVEAALLRTARRRRRANDHAEGGGGGRGEESATSGVVRNMLLARIGSGTTSQGGSFSFSSAGVGGSPAFPEPPTAVIQALNKQAAPGRFTEGDSRAVRTLAPAVVAGSRLIMSLLSSSADGSWACRGGDRRQSPSIGQTEGASRSPEEALLLEGLRRARHGLGADRARIFVLNRKFPGDEYLQLWHEEPPQAQSLLGLARPSLRDAGGSVGDGLARMASRVGPQGVALATGRAAVTADALSDPLYDRELDLREGFLARSVLCVPLLDRSDGRDHDERGAPLGVLQLAFGRAAAYAGESPGGSGNGRERGSRSGWSEEADRKKAFSPDDEPLAEAFAKEIAVLLVHLINTGFRPRASVTSLAGGGGHVGAGIATRRNAPGAGMERSESGRRSSRGEAMVGSDRLSHDGAYAADAVCGETGATDRREAVRANLTEQSPMARRNTAQARTAQQGRHPSGGGGSTGSANATPNAAGATSPEIMSHGGRDTVTRGVESRGGARGPLATSTASTAGLSPLGVGVRASVATAGHATPVDSPTPPSPATDGSGGSNDDHSRDRLPNHSQGPQQQQQPPGVGNEVTQSRSWATAHRVLEACKESLAADKRSRQNADRRCGGSGGSDECLREEPRPHAAATNAERIAPAVCSLVSSLLPGCSAVLLLLETGTGRLHHAGCELGPGGAVDRHGLPQVAPCRVRREDVACRALASGKALLARARENSGGEEAPTAADNGGRGGGPAEVDDSAVGQRVFCIPVCVSAGRKDGVLQLFLPPAPLLRSPISTPPHSPSSAEIGNGSAPGSPRTASCPPPPPSFFMAAKIVADSVGLALGWCEALDREEADRVAETAALAVAAETSAEAHERNRRQLEAKHHQELKAAEEAHAVRIAEVADAHARAIASLLEGRESLAAAVAKVASRTRGRKDAARALAAWRDASKRAQRADRIVARMDERRRARALREWRARTLAKGRIKVADDVGAATADKRGLRRAIGAWARASARGRCVKERRLAGARLVGEVFRRSGPVKRRFVAWRGSAQAVLAERQVLAQKSAGEEAKARAGEEVARAEARARRLAARVAELSRRRKNDRLVRSASLAWFNRVRELGRRRESLRAAGAWRRRRGLTSILTRWRLAAAPTALPSPGPTAGSGVADRELTADAKPASPQAAGVARDPRSPRSRGESNSVAEAVHATGKAEEEAKTAGSSAEEARHAGDADAGTVGVVVVRRPVGAEDDTGLVAATINSVNASPRPAAAESPADGGVGGENQRRQALEEHLERLAKAAADTFRRQRDRMASLRLLAAWRRATVVERSRTEALSRILRSRCKRRLSGEFARWRAVSDAAGVVAARRRSAEAAVVEAAVAAEKVNRAREEDEQRKQETAAELQRSVHAAREEMAVAAAAAVTNAATAAKEAAATVALAREQELRCERDAVVELQKTVEALRAEATENALRHQKADAYLIERDARASLLSLAAARAFRQGRERVQAARALGFLRDTARRRRFASAAAAKTSNIRASRCLRVWTTAAKRTRRQQAASSCASAFAAEFAARSAKDAARRFLRQWAEGSRRRRDALAAAERLRVRRQRAALFSWRDACRNREALAAASREIATRLARSSARRALRGWREATFGGLSGSAGGDFVAAANEGGGEGRVLARLMDVGVRVDEAGARRRAKKALRDWLARTKGARRRVLVERRAKETLTRGNVAVALLRWRTVCLVRRRLRRARDRGTSWAALHGVRRGWSAWCERVQHAARRRRADLAIEAAPANRGRSTSPPGDRSGPCGFVLAAEEALGPPPPTTSSECEAGTTITPLAPQDARDWDQRGAAHPRAPPGGGSGEFGRNQTLLDLLVDVCAAPPPYSLGLGIGALGNDACRVAMRTFGLLSAALFEVVSNPQAVAIRVAAVQAGGEAERRGVGGERAADSAAAAAVAAASESGLPERERLGEGTVGVAAQSARPVCIEVVCPASGGGGSVTGATVASSTVLCIPIMLQAAPLPKALTGFVGGRDEGPAASVEVVGVLRAVRAGTGAFAGDDARALSAFCGQLALAVVAERAIKDSRAMVAREARALRRRACRRVAELFADGAVAGALLGRAGAEKAQVKAGQARVEKEERLWSSVAGLAAQALGCERVDLLRVASLAGDVPPFSDLLSQPPPSRSFRKRSREALMAARASSRSSPSSQEGASSVDAMAEEMAESWLCVPVLRASGEARDAAGGRGREKGGAVTVCCAMNKGNGRSFDDVDEAMLATIAALYAVAASWLPRPTPQEAPGYATSPTLTSVVRAGLSVAAGMSTGSASGGTTRSVRTTGVNTSPKPQRRSFRDAGTSPRADVHPSNRVDGDPAHVSSSRVHRSGRGSPPAARDDVGGDVWVENYADGCYALGMDERSSRQRDNQRVRGNGGVVAADAQPGVRPYRTHARPEPRLLEEDGARGSSQAPGRTTVSQPPPPAPQAFDAAGEENVQLRRRAERAERMLDATRERLCRALEDGAANAAAAADAAAAATVVTAAVNAKGSGGQVGDEGRGGGVGGEGRGGRRRGGPLDTVERCDSESDRASVSLSVSDGRDGVVRRRGTSAERLHTAATAGAKATRRSKSSGGRRGGHNLAPPPPNYASSSDHSGGGRRRCYSGDDTGDHRRWRRPEQDRCREPAELPDEQGYRGRQARSPTSASSSSTMSRTGDDDRMTQGDGVRGGGTDGASGRSTTKGRPRRRVELRASDLVRMREVVARLRIATSQLERERAERLDVTGRGGNGRLPGSVLGEGDAQPVTEAAGPGGGGAVEEGEAAALARENANLRRKLRGLVALEELEGKAVQRGLLPLTGGGVPGGDFFSGGKRK